MGKFRKSSGRQAFAGMKVQQKATPLIYVVPTISFTKMEGEKSDWEIRNATKAEKDKYVKKNPKNKLKKIKVVERKDYHLTVPITCWHFNSEDVNLPQTAHPRNCYPPTYASHLTRNLEHDKGLHLYCTPDTFLKSFIQIKGNEWYPKELPFEGNPSSHELATRLEVAKRFCVKEEDYNRLKSDMRSTEKQLIKTSFIKIGTIEDMELWKKGANPAKEIKSPSKPAQETSKPSKKSSKVGGIINLGEEQRKANLGLPNKLVKS
jgi:hypothetical protein